MEKMGSKAQAFGSARCLIVRGLPFAKRGGWKSIPEVSEDLPEDFAEASRLSFAASFDEVFGEADDVAGAAD
jgi:hypothetical protein